MGAAAPAIGPGTAGLRSKLGSVRLSAQERRDVELVFLEGVVHRRLPAEGIEPLVSRTLGIFRHWLGTSGHGGRRHGRARRWCRPVHGTLRGPLHWALDR